MEENLTGQTQTGDQVPAVSPPVQPPRAPTPPQRLRWKRLFPIFLILLVLVVGGVGLVWRTDYLDRFLPRSIKEFSGRGELSQDEPKEASEEKTPYAGKLAYLLDGEVWVINPDRTGKGKITDTGEAITRFHFSPDGGSLAYVAQKSVFDPEIGEEVLSSENLELSLLDLSTRKIEVLVEMSSEDNPLGAFAFSRDGTRLAYSRGGIWVLNLSTRGVKQIRKPLSRSPSFQGFTYVEWSPGDKRILVEQSFDAGYLFEVFNADGSDRIELDGWPAEGFIDDDRIVISSYLHSAFGGPLSSDQKLYWVSLSTPNKENTIMGDLYVVGFPLVYSRVLGKVLFFVDCEKECAFQENELYSVSLGGEGLTKLTDLAVEEYWYAFPIREIVTSPLGEVGLLVTRVEGEEEFNELWAVDPEMITQKKVLEVAGDIITQIEWVPN